jgi:hypothetical protein
MNIEENKDRFESLIKNDSILSMLSGTNDLLNFLSESDFYYAPASINYHGNYEGGLCEHCLQVYDNIFRVSSIFENNYTIKTLTLVSLLHDICKINIYQKEKRNRKKKDEKGFDILNKKGLPIWEEIEVYAINDLNPLGHGEKSVIILQQYYQLTKDEIFAIRWHMGGYDDITKSYIGNLTINNACNICPLITILHIADLSSIFLQLTSNILLNDDNEDWVHFQDEESLIKENY